MINYEFVYLLINLIYYDIYILFGVQGATQSFWKGYTLPENCGTENEFFSSVFDRAEVGLMIGTLRQLHFILTTRKHTQQSHPKSRVAIT